MVDCATALENTQALALFSDDAVVFDAFELNTKPEIAAYYVAICEVVQELTNVYGGGEPGFFHFTTRVNQEEDSGLQCNKGVAYDFATGLVGVAIDSLGIAQLIPLRETNGMVKDKTKEFSWALSHLHRSANIETSIDLALQVAGFGLDHAIGLHGDIANFVKIMQAPGLAKGAVESCNLHLAKYFA